jgi:hypothetical protein
VLVPGLGSPEGCSLLGLPQATRAKTMTRASSIARIFFIVRFLHFHIVYSLKLTQQFRYEFHMRLSPVLPYGAPDSASGSHAGGTACLDAWLENGRTMKKMILIQILPVNGIHLHQFTVLSPISV